MLVQFVAFRFGEMVPLRVVSGALHTLRPQLDAVIVEVYRPASTGYLRRPLISSAQEFPNVIRTVSNAAECIDSVSADRSQGKTTVVITSAKPEPSFQLRALACDVEVCSMSLTLAGCDGGIDCRTMSASLSSLRRHRGA